MGRSLSCCSSPLCSQNGTLLEARQGLRISEKGVAKGSQTALKQFCDFAQDQHGGNAAEILRSLADRDDDIVTRDQFLRHIEQSGFRGDLDVVYDALDASCEGQPRLEELRAQLSSLCSSGGATSSGKKNSKRNSSKGEFPPAQTAPGRLSKGKSSLSPARNNSKEPKEKAPDTDVRSNSKESKEKAPGTIMDASTRSTLGPKEPSKTLEPTTASSPHKVEDGKIEDVDGENSSRKGSKENRQGSKEKRPDSKGASGRRRRNSVRGSQGEDADQSPSKASCVSLAVGMSYVEKRAGSKHDPASLTAPVAGPIEKDGSPTVDVSDFVVLRPLPYELSLPDRNDDNEQRKFVYKGRVIEIPFLPLSDFEPGTTGESQAKGKGWQVVKSKVVGGNLKSLE